MYLEKSKMSDEEIKALQDVLVSKYWILKQIKRRCHNATPQDMIHATEAAKCYNSLVKPGTLRASACQIPHNVRLIGLYLRGIGRINDPDLIV